MRRKKLPKPTSPPPPQIKTLAESPNLTNDTLSIPYEREITLNTIFSAERAADDTSTAALTLEYALERQPSFAEGSGEWTPYDAYSVTAGTLSALAGKRVPDVLAISETRSRAVREGVLKVSVNRAGYPGAAATATYVVKMTGKPDLVPVITLAEGLTGVENGTLTLTTWGQPRQITRASFKIALEFEEEDIKVDIGNAGDDSYITTSLSGAIQAGGSSGKAGTGGFVVAYYKDNTLQEVLADETLPQAKLYVNVTFVDPPEVVGIELNVAAIGKCSTASFWKTGQKTTTAFVLAKLNDGTTRAYDSSQDGSLLSGNFNANTKGAGTENASHAGWYPNVNLNGTPETDAELSWTITHANHFEETAWTVVVTTKKLAENPGTCN
ncbi:MAG: hypothetical protein LBT49_02540 [Prevotellaceae bacterium]|jgi:hypothetical protein|nr:hypothetical protein [Prevotellaceae bacterium]